MLGDVLMCELKLTLFYFYKNRNKLRSEYNGLRTVYNLPMSVRLVNTAEYSYMYIYI